MSRARALRLLPLAAALVVAGCQAVGVPSPAAEASLMSVASPTQTATPSPSLALPIPGRPYAASELLAAMRDSRRPGGVPDAVETEAIAEMVAAELWTWDGNPWDQLAIGGSCAPERCSLEVAGMAAGRTDVYSFVVDVASGSVSVEQADLHAYSGDFDPQLDALVRAGVDAARLEGMALVGGAWLRPPDAGRFLLPYRSGGEEGSPGLDILVDLPERQVLSVTESG